MTAPGPADGGRCGEHGLTDCEPCDIEAALIDATRRDEARRTVTVPADGGAATGGLGEETLIKLAATARDLATTSAVSFREAYSTLVEALALVDQARAEGAAEERERNTYRNEDGEELHCPRCGGPDPEGYPQHVLDD